MEYNFRDIEQKWQEIWNKNGIYNVLIDPKKPKYYVLDMFPYPSGAGLHVGHPLGYIASDIYARFKRHKGFNVLHPMGFDAFGLPAEQYALETGQHPAVTTQKNIQSFKKQLNHIGFSYDWSREVQTCDPAYYKWTQWIFLQLYSSWFNRTSSRAESINSLIHIFEKEGNRNHPAPSNPRRSFDAQTWNSLPDNQKEEILMEYRLAYCSYGEVNWCEALGTVLANDEVINGLSERGGHPVVKKKLRQWYLRITEYADRLLEGLNSIDFSDAMKEMQTNWIGKSTGAEIDFDILESVEKIKVYTTRPDTIFGVDFMVLAPEHTLVDSITTNEFRDAVAAYKDMVNTRSERERISEKRISGCFTGAYAIHPFTHKKIPIWISEYVLAGYGTGAIMAVPCGDDRDHKFAQHFSLPITNIIGSHYNGEEANPTKDAILQNSDFLDGLDMRTAMKVVVEKLSALKKGNAKINFKMRDAAFSRQRYWGEPFPIVWEKGTATPLSEDSLPLELPHVDQYRPGPEGEGPLANISSWTKAHYETNTMPGYAGSSWYFLRYMDPQNTHEFCSRDCSNYWNQVDVYIGGTEHAVGHLLYSRMWTKVLFDLGFISFDEPYKKLINQGMITGKSVYVTGALYKDINSGKSRLWLRSHHSNLEFPPMYKDESGTSWDCVEIMQDIRLRNGHKYLDANERLTRSRWQQFMADPNQSHHPFADCIIDWESEKVTESGEPYLEGVVIEKMSKSKYNVENPDDVIDKYGADTFRMYEMFLGPLEQSKPWDTQGIEGVHRFLKKFWRLYVDEQRGKIVLTDQDPTEDEWRVLHKTIKKVDEDTERFSFNTAISQFMICVNELAGLKCRKRAILEPLLILLSPYAPHICEQLWEMTGHQESVLLQGYPTYNEEYLQQSSVMYPVAINGKTRTEMSFSLEMDDASIKDQVLKNDIVAKWTEGKPPKKIIVVKGRMINIVI